MSDKEQLSLEKAWTNFEKSGRIVDYMDYVHIKRDIFGEYLDF